MPELPEVETIRRELQESVLGKRIVDVLIRHPAVIKQPEPSVFARRVKGAAIKNILRKGKLLILELSSLESLCIHLKMTGQLICPGTAKTSRVSFKLSDGRWLDFLDRRLLGELRLVKDWRALAFVRELGPEPFDLTSEKFQQMLTGRKTRIKPLLMDQTFISGVGNLYAAEALFRARLHPNRSSADLTEAEKIRLLAQLRDTLKEAIRLKGSSVDQYVQLSGEPGGYVREHKVYGREKKPCLVCHEPIQRIVLAGRGTYFCPRCQK